MEQNSKGWIAAVVALSVGLGSICIALSIVLIGFITKSNLYGTQLENMYQRSFYELTQNVNDMELDISKLVATTTKSAQQTLLANTYNDCVKATNNLANLPIKSEQVSSFYYTVNRIGGYIYSLLQSVNQDQDISEEQYTKLEEIHGVALSLMWDINSYASTLDIDYEIINSIDWNNPDNNDFTGGITVGDKEEIPTLIYDGPFSDSVLNKEVQGLGSDEYTVEEASNILKEKLSNVYTITNLIYQGETNGKIVTYNYRVDIEGYSFYVQISKIGAMIINISGYGKADQKNITEKEAKAIAPSFANAMGIENMQPVWVSADENVYYVNLAYTYQDIIYYPDLIKVKIDKNTGMVIGYEATNYATNHVTRAQKSPTISSSDAEEKVSTALTVHTIRLTVIPNEFVGETLCYECIATWKDYEYYVYINAETGEEENILRVVKTSHGDLIE